jgi:hypothetical protein
MNLVAELNLLNISTPPYKLDSFGVKNLQKQNLPCILFHRARYSGHNPGYVLNRKHFRLGIMDLKEFRYGRRS